MGQYFSVALWKSDLEKKNIYMISNRKFSIANDNDTDPKLEATQIPGAVDANDEFAIEHETPRETSVSEMIL